jgi:PAS domain S-box-containing protein
LNAILNTKSHLIKIKYILSLNDKKFIELSTNIKEIIGYSKEEIINNNLIWVNKIIHKDDVKIYNQKFTNNNLEINNTINYRLLTQKKQFVHVSDCYNTFTDTQGDKFIKGTIQLIGNSKQIKIQIAKNSLLAFDKSFIISITDITGKIIYANDYFKKCSEYSELELIGKNHNILKSGYHLNDFYSNLWNTIKSGKTWRGDICNKSKSGKIYWVDTTISPIIENGKIIEYISIRKLITDKKNKEIESLNNQLKIRQLIDTIDDVIFQIDTKGNILKLNNAFEIHTGFKTKNWIGMPFSKIIHPNDLETAQNAFANLLSGNNVKPYEIKVLTKKKNYIPVEIKPGTLTKNGFIVSILGVARNLTEKKRTEEKLDFLNKTISIKTGNSFFNDLAIFFTNQLGFDASIIATKQNKFNTFKSISVCEKGILKNNFITELETLNDFLLSDENYILFQNLNSETDKAISFHKYKAKSYFAIAFRNQNNSVYGLIILIHKTNKKIDTDKTDLIIQTIPRIKAELMRLESDIKLKEREAFNTDILSTITSRIAVINHKGDIVKVNDAWIQFGLESGVKNIHSIDVGANYFEATKPALIQNDVYATKAIKGLKAIIANKTHTFKMEYPLISNDEKNWYMLTASRLSGSDNLIVVRHVEITDSKKNEEKIRKSEELFKNLIQHSNELIFSLNSNNRIEFCNTNFLQLLKSNKIINETESFPDLLEYPYSSVFLKSLNKSILDKKPQNVTVKLKTKNNLELKGTIVPVFKNNVINSYQCYFKDISDLKKTSLEKKQIENRHRDILNNLNDAVIIRNEREKITYANKSFYQLFNIEPVDTPLISMIDVIEPGWQSYVRRSYKKKKKNQSAEINIEYKAQKSNHQIIWIKEKITTFKDVDDKIKTLSILSDITEIKTKEIELQNIVNDLSNRNNEMLQFNYIVSHNLRAPIANISGLVDLIEQKLVNGAEYDLVIKHIKDSTNKLDEVIMDLNRVLDAKTTSTKTKEKFHVKEIINTVYSSLESQILESKCKFNLQYQEKFPLIKSIKSYFTSIFYNLISNSIKFRSHDKEPNISINFSYSDHEIKIVYKDNGIGFDLKNNSNSVFKLYKRFNSEIEGKGLGLHMTKLQIEALNGKIELESELNKGTTFYLNFPLEK